MPIAKRWTRFTKANIQKLPNVTGMYEIADRDKKVVYRGGSDDEARGVRGRLMSHITHKRCPGATYFRILPAALLETGTDLEATHSHGRAKPRFTKRSPRAADIFGYPLDD